MQRPEISTDHSVQLIWERFTTQAELVINPENLGGSRGFNAGMRSVLAANDASGVLPAGAL